MGHLLYGYRIGLNGQIDYRKFDSDNFPEGWVDSPSKLEAPPEIKRDTAPALQPVVTGEVYGERRRPGRPRKAV